MNRQQKELVVESLQGQLDQSNATFLVGVKGLSVSQMESLRANLRAKGGKLKVAKARLMRLAIEKNEQDLQVLKPYLKNQIGVVFAHDEAPSVAKILSDFSKENESLVLIAGAFDNNFLDAQGVVRVASLPPREQLLAQLCGTLEAPVAELATVLDVLIKRLVWTLKAIEESKK